MGIRDEVSSLGRNLRAYHTRFSDYRTSTIIHQDIEDNINDILKFLSDAAKVVESLLQHFDDDYLCKHSRDITHFQYDAYQYIDTVWPLIIKYDPSSQDEYNQLANSQDDLHEAATQSLIKILPQLEPNPATRLRFEVDSPAMTEKVRDPKGSRLKKISHQPTSDDHEKYPYGIIYEAIRSAHAARIEALSFKFDALVEARSESEQVHKDTLVQHLPHDVIMPLMEEGFLNLASLEKILTPDYYPEQAKVTRTQYKADNRALEKVNQQLCRERKSYYTFTAGYIALRTSEEPRYQMNDVATTTYSAYKLF